MPFCGESTRRRSGIPRFLNSVNSGQTENSTPAESPASGLTQGLNAHLSTENTGITGGNSSNETVNLTEKKLPVPKWINNVSDNANAGETTISLPDPKNNHNLHDHFSKDQIICKKSYIENPKRYSVELIGINKTGVYQDTPWNKSNIKRHKAIRNRDYLINIINEDDDDDVNQLAKYSNSDNVTSKLNNQSVGIHIQAKPKQQLPLKFLENKVHNHQYYERTVHFYYYNRSPDPDESTNKKHSPWGSFSSSEPCQKETTSKICIYRARKTSFLSKTTPAQTAAFQSLERNKEVWYCVPMPSCDAKQKNTHFLKIENSLKKNMLKKNIVQKIFFFFFFLQFKERKRHFDTLECLFCHSYYILHNTGCKILNELYLY